MDRSIEVLGNCTDNESDENLDEQDPEVKPGLFQGDMALTNEIYNYWRVGLNWEVFPNRLWKDGIVPYVISPLYGKAQTKSQIKQSNCEILFWWMRRIHIISVTFANCICTWIKHSSL